MITREDWLMWGDQLQAAGDPRGADLVESLRRDKAGLFSVQSALHGSNGRRRRHSVALWHQRALEALPMWWRPVCLFQPFADFETTANRCIGLIIDVIEAQLWPVIRDEFYKRVMALDPERDDLGEWLAATSYRQAAGVAEYVHGLRRDSDVALDGGESTPVAELAYSDSLRINAPIDALRAPHSLGVWADRTAQCIVGSPGVLYLDSRLSKAAELFVDAYGSTERIGRALWVEHLPPWCRGGE